jgi:hypothetical protein
MLEMAWHFALISQCCQQISNDKKLGTYPQMYVLVF